MGVREPTLEVMFRQFTVGVDKERFGKRRAVVQCRHGGSSTTIAEVRGNVLFAYVGPHDLWHANYEILAFCDRCPDQRRRVDLRKIRAALVQPHDGLVVLDADDVAPRVDANVGRPGLVV